MFSLKVHRCYTMEHYSIIFHSLKTWSCWISQRTAPPREKYYTFISAASWTVLSDVIDLLLSGWFTSIFCYLTWHENLSPVLVDYFGRYCSCSVQLWLVSVLNRAEPSTVREMCHFCPPISALPCLLLAPDVCSLQQRSPYYHQLHPLTTQFSPTTQF